MKHRMILAGAVSLLGCFGANAEPLRVVQAPPGALPAFEAVTITRSLGLDPLGGPVWRNGRYVVSATDDDGREMRVVLDARSGDVLAVRPVAAGYFAPPPSGARGDYRMHGGYVVDDDGYIPERDPYATPLERPVAPKIAAVQPSKPVTSAKKAVTKTAKPKQSAAVTPVPTPKPEPQSESRPAPASAPSDAAKKDIRKIEIYRTPTESSGPAAGETGGKTPDGKSSDDRTSGDDASDGKTDSGFPINPLL